MARAGAGGSRLLKFLGEADESTEIIALTVTTISRTIISLALMTANNKWPVREILGTLHHARARLILPQYFPSSKPFNWCARTTIIKAGK